MSTVVEGKDGLDLICELHDAAGVHLKNFCSVHRQMITALTNSFSVMGTAIPTPAAVVAKPSDPAPVASSVLPKKVEAESEATTRDTNSISLRQAVWNVMSTPENKAGLKVAQIIATIKESKSWVTGGDLGGMVHSAVHALKKQEKVVRGDDKTYRIKAGAILD